MCFLFIPQNANFVKSLSWLCILGPFPVGSSSRSIQTPQAVNQPPDTPVRSGAPGGFIRSFWNPRPSGSLFNNRLTAIRLS